MTSSVDSLSDDAHRPDHEGTDAVAQARRDQQRAFECAAEAVVCREGQGSGDPASFGVEIRNLESWACAEGKLIAEQEIDSLVLVSNQTSEHQVFYRQPDDRAVKRTWAGVYGQLPVISAGKVDRRNSTPSEYLQRMALHIEVFASDLRLEGVCISEKPSMIIGQPAGQPSLVISQRWYEKEGVATTEDIHDLLTEEGFRAIPSSYFGWYRLEDGVVIVDAKPDNFIKTHEGLIPIDLQMAQFDEKQLAAAGLRPEPGAPVIFIPR